MKLGFIEHKPNEYNANTMWKYRFNKKYASYCATERKNKYRQRYKSNGKIRRESSNSTVEAEFDHSFAKIYNEISRFFPFFNFALEILFLMIFSFSQLVINL